MIVKNKSKRCIRVNKTVLKPGSNLLTKKQEENFNKSIDFVERLIDNGVLEIPGVSDLEEKSEKKSKEAAAKVTSVSDLNAKDAIALVKDTFDKEALEKFMEGETDRDEPRLTVIKAIEKQIQNIENAQNGKKGEDEEDE